MSVNIFITYPITSPSSPHIALLVDSSECVPVLVEMICYHLLDSLHNTATIHHEVQPSLHPPPLPKHTLSLLPSLKLTIDGEQFSISSLTSLVSWRQANPMLIAVSCLSPVNIHTFIPASFRLAMASGTPWGRVGAEDH